MRKTAQQVFDEWGRDHRGQGMEKHHWPRVQQAFDLIPNQTGKYLEIGTGTGYALYYIATHQFAKGQCYGLEISEQMVCNSKQKVADLKNVTIHQGDFLTWQFPAKDKFSLIFSMEVFYYFADMQAAIAKAFSLLKPGGQLWVLVNYYKENTESHDWPDQLNTPMQLWSMADYRNGFEKAGFRQVEQLQLSDKGTIEFKESAQSTLCTYGSR